MFLLLAAVALHVTPSQVPQELGDYLMRKDASFAWKLGPRSDGRWDLSMTSQTWRGTVWEHSLVIVEPAELRHKGSAVVIVTGGGVNDADLQLARTAANATGMPVATLFDIPNQPLWGMKEDDLIAHTFSEFLRSEEPDWPLLFPMAKSAIRALDALEAATKNEPNPLQKFIVTGASKRGWTSWLVGASGDRRVIGIAPMLYDNLAVGQQMRRQVEYWGEYSGEIADYTRRNLQAALRTPIGQRLARIVDPFSYLESIRAPTLIVNGANDPYWTVDALSVYWKQLSQPRWALLLPNTGHSIGDGRRTLETFAAFARSCAGEFRLPSYDAGVEFGGGGSARACRAVYAFDGGECSSIAVWIAESDDLKFAGRKWRKAAERRSSDESPIQGKGELDFDVDPTKNTAAFLEMRFRTGGSEYSLCSPASIALRKQ